MSAAVSECIFCGIVAGDLPAEIVDSDEHTVAFMDINPATPGHALVIPRAHTADLMDTADEDLERTTDRGAAARAADGRDPGARRVQHPQRVPRGRVATVFHYHLHVIPRYEDDPLKLPWIPRGAEGDEIAAVARKIRGD